MKGQCIQQIFKEYGISSTRSYLYIFVGIHSLLSGANNASRYGTVSDK